MKLLLAVTSLFAASVAAAKYTPGQDCRTNKGCDENCIGGKWSVIIEAGDVRMVCDPSTLNSDRYFSAICQFGNRYFTDEANGATRYACDKMKGKVCGEGVRAPICYFTGKASQEEDLTTAFQNVCADKLVSGEEHGRGYSASVQVYPTKNGAIGGSYDCDESVFS